MEGNNKQTTQGNAAGGAPTPSPGIGMVPNFLRVFANSPDSLRAFLGLHEIAGTGELDELTRERIALSLAEQNECEYCVSAHTARSHLATNRDTLKPHIPDWLANCVHDTKVLAPIF